MRTNELLSLVDIPRHKLYYLETKGYINPDRIPMGDLEAREYSEEDLQKVKANIIGVVLNEVRMNHMDTYYYKGYHGKYIGY